MRSRSPSLVTWPGRRKSELDGVLVLGMHRSGTSVATRIVNMLGPATCRAEDMVRGPWNPRGHWESRTLMHLDDELLAEMGCTWWHPPPTGESYFEASSRIRTTPAVARRCFRKVHLTRPWVWKDPRACLLIPFWRQTLGPRLASVVVVRNPLEVAASLARRHGVSGSFAIALWERYNRLLLAHLRGMPTLVTSYEELMGDAVEWTSRATEFLSASGLRPLSAVEPEALREFVDLGLRHATHTESEVGSEAPSALEVYAAFGAAAGSSASFVPPELAPERPSVQEELSKVGPGRKLEWYPPPWSNDDSREDQRVPGGSGDPAGPTRSEGR